MRNASFFFAKILPDLCNSKALCATSPGGGSRDFVAVRPVSPFRIEKRYAKGWAKCDASLERGDDHNPKLCYEANSMAILVANETVWAADAEKTQNRQRCD
jgi:hypothetical protein